MRKAVAIDIDGVILKGGYVLNGAKKALSRLIENKIPFIFVTNGGGTTESQKAKDMTKKLQIDFRSDQMLLSHTPMKELAQQFGSSQTLVLGHSKCIDVAKSYGFKRILTAEDVYNKVPTIYPNRTPPVNASSAYEPTEPIETALIIHDPQNWALEMQVLSDLLSPLGPLSNGKQVHLYSCNADLVYATEHPHPRFTQGAFVETFRHLYQLQHGRPLDFTYYGKPFPIQYQYAERMLRHESSLLGLREEPTVFFGIGDNPLSDIRGANNAGAHWKSILVRTGLYKSDRDDYPHSEDVPDFVRADIEAAVECILDYR